MLHSTPKNFSRFASVLLGCMASCLAVPGGAAAADAAPVPQVLTFEPPQAGDLPPGTGFVPPPDDLSHLKAPPAAPYLPLAARFDWRETGKVTPVKNQGTCGSCYAFAALANVESRLLINGAGAFDFSENNVKECEYFGSSCGGGNDWIVAHYLSTKGTVLEACDPYVAANVACTGGCAYQKTLLDWRVISGSEVPSVSVLKSYIQTYGPVYAAMYAGSGDAWSSEFQRYNGSYTLHYGGSEACNHAILIVGWDDNLAHAGGTGAWIVKNSWGTSWGGTCGYGAGRGYFTIAYGSARIGSYSSFLCGWQDFDPEGELLFLDEGGHTGSMGYMNKTAYGLCKFIPEEDQLLERVEFWTLDQTVDVDVYVYDTFTGGVPSGLLASKLNCTFDLAGYHSVQLPSPLHLAAGNDIYAVVKITDASYTYPLSFDTVGPESPGCSYISPTGAYYSEFTNGDLGIRLRVSQGIACSELAEVPVVTGIADVASDGGGQVNVSWKRSLFDQEDASPAIRTYRVWRKIPDALGSDGGPGDHPATNSGDGPQAGGPYEAGPAGLAWELVGTVPATGACCYSLAAPTQGNTSSTDTCWTYFYVSAHTGIPGLRFDSAVARGYSVNNLDGASPPDGDPGHDTLGPEISAGYISYLSSPEPNPTKDGFDLRFGLSKPCLVELNIYDVSGRRVATVLAGTLDPGPYTARWDGDIAGAAGPASGIYLASLVAGSEIRAVKLVLAR